MWLVNTLQSGENKSQLFWLFILRFYCRKLHYSICLPVCHNSDKLKGVVKLKKFVVITVISIPIFFLEFISRTNKACFFQIFSVGEVDLKVDSLSNLLKLLFQLITISEYVSQRKFLGMPRKDKRQLAFIGKCTKWCTAYIA